MKTIKFILAAIFAVMLSFNIYAQTPKVVNKTESFKVAGNCETCERSIEKAAKINGVSKADWNMKTGLLSVTYNPSKANTDLIQKAIAGVGYDTPKFIAADKVYSNLPGCCKYR